jgi:subtilisin family serine protease
MSKINNHENEPIKKIYILLFLFLMSVNLTAFSQGYYNKGVFIPLSGPQEKLEGSLNYKTKSGIVLKITNKIIIKTLHAYENGYFENKYNLKLVKHYGKVLILEVSDISNVLKLCQEIYESESVKYVQPSFSKSIKSNRISVENLKSLARPLIRKHSLYDLSDFHIQGQATFNITAMLDSENSVNYWKYYDDVFRYADESVWHLHNKGGFIAQSYFDGEFYDVLSLADVDTNALQVIDRGITGKGVKLAVVDSSFELTHPDLRFSNSHNFNLNNKDVTPDSTADFHGTSVAGVIGANKGNNYGTMGVAPDAYMVAFNGLFDIEDDEIFSQSYIDIFYKALELNIDIINCSWSTTSIVDEASEDAINTFISEAREGKGGFVVFSSGNEGSTSLSNEAALDGVISVGSIEANGTRSLYSNFGAKLDLVAPSNFVGLDLVGENGFAENEMGFVAGTSFSAPIVSGIIALMLEAHPTIKLNDALNILYSTTKQVGAGDYTHGSDAYEYLYEIDDSTKYNVLYPKSVETGYGLIDAEKAVDLALKYKAESEPDNEKESEHGNILRDLKLGWNLVGTSAEIVDFDIFNDVSIVWYFIDDTWMGYSANLDYAKSLRRQNKLATIIPKNSGLWVYKDGT